MKKPPTKLENMSYFPPAVRGRGINDGRGIKPPWVVENERGQTSPARNKNIFNPNSTYSFGHPGIYEISISRTDGQVLPVRNFCQVRWFIYDLFSGFTNISCWYVLVRYNSPCIPLKCLSITDITESLKAVEEIHLRRGTPLWKIFDCSSNFSALRWIRLIRLIRLSKIKTPISGQNHIVGFPWHHF